MSKEKWNDELSAFLDGEARDPARIQRLIAEDPELAARHQQFAKISEHLRTLPAPDVRPEFLTRVMAHVREQESAPARPAWWRFVLPVATLAMLAVVAGSMWRNRADSPATADPPVATVSHPVVGDPVADAVDLTNDEAVVTYLAALFERGEIIADVSADDYVEGEAEGEVSGGYASAWTILEDENWEEAYLDSFGSDWYSELDAIETDEWAVFDEVVYEYLNEDVS